MRKKAFAVLILLWSVSIHAAAHEQKLMEKDLAFALPLSSRAVSSESFLPRAWYRSVHQAFLATSAGNVLEIESPYSDWQLISMRIAPCSPLSQTPLRAEVDCWPEVRLVWQPVLRKIRLHERYMEAAGDDRAIHAIYPTQGQGVLNGEEMLRALNYRQTLTQGAQLDVASRSDFESLRARVITALMDASLKLRDPQLAESTYMGHGIRPETNDPAREQQLFKRLTDFLNRFTRPQDLRFLTAFSLPEGREPAHLDEWVFLSFRAEQARLIQDPIEIRSAKDGRMLASLGPSIRGSQGRDADELYDLLGTGETGRELSDSVMFYISDIRRLTPAVADRRQLLVGNTSCISCHKMNELRFDFHNFSYLEDRDITLSPRLKRDVELDLLWLRAFYSGL
ncbi:MAG: hypothetical protein ACOVS5_16045 [Oligoflexus sp.]|jgi:hypothetical protein